MIDPADHLLKLVGIRLQMKFESKPKTGNIIHEMKHMVRGAKSKTTDAKPEKEKKSYYVYLLLCDDGSYYTGYTNNVVLRFERHKKGHGARYTRIRRPERVVYVEEFVSRGDAIRREQQIKSLSHREKHELIGSHRSIELSD
jgi:putative endonuclease